MQKSGSGGNAIKRHYDDSHDTDRGRIVGMAQAAGESPRDAGRLQQSDGARQTGVAVVEVDGRAQVGAIGRR